MPQSAKARINQLRRSIHVHSVMYYQLNESTIPDHTYDAWSRELALLQKAFPQLKEGGYRPDLFADWTGETGFHLPVTPQMECLANQLLEAHRQRQEI